MRKIIASLCVSLDGVVQDPGDWRIEHLNDELVDTVEEQLGFADTVLLGRKTYDAFTKAWPGRDAGGGAEAGIAGALGDSHKLVVSNQDLQFIWRNCEQLEGDLIEAVGALKKKPGDRNILICGSASVVRQLVTAHLVDELDLFVHPVVVRTGGTRLFDDIEPVALTLTAWQKFDTGVVNLVYGRAESAASESEDCGVVLYGPLFASPDQRWGRDCAGLVADVGYQPGNCSATVPVPR